MSGCFPIFLRLAGKKAVVIGGGAVGRRKAAVAVAAGANVRLVSLDAPPADFHVPGVDWRTEPYRPNHLDGAALVFAAATPAVNAAVAADAAARGVWVCDAVDPARGDFVLPGVARAGGLTVAVGTGGAAPALTRRVAQKIRAEFDAAFGEWVDLLAELRPVVLSTVPDPAARRALLDGLADWPWLDRLRRDGKAATRAAMLAAVSRGAEPGGGTPPG